MVRDSTSLSRLNADRRLTKPAKAAYLVLNWLNNRFAASRVDPALSFQQFRCPDINRYWSSLGVRTSPARRLSDLFWATLPWQAIGDELGQIHIMDTGCGDGCYAQKLRDYSDGGIASYFGVDAREHPNWLRLQEQYPGIRFEQVAARAITNSIPEATNLFITQSALEHIDQDLAYFDAVRAHIAKRPEPALQVHLIPSAACLKLYLWHGVRQYTPRTISKITKRFDDNAYAVLFQLGGPACNDVFWNFVTKPLRILRGEDLRVTRTREYEERLLEAVQRDMGANLLPHGPASFYALVVHSNPRQSIFR